MSRFELTREQRIILDTFQETELTKSFYWSGGTALAYHYLQHRYSYDIDFFSDSPFSFDSLIPFFDKLKEKLQISELNQKRTEGRWLTTLPKPYTMQIDFVHYNHEKKRIHDRTPWEKMQIDSLDDIAANKVLAYMDRTEPKDLLDIYYLLTKGSFTADTLLELVKKKIDMTISPFSFWSESAKSLKLIDSIHPYLIANSEEEKRHIIADMQKYFREKGRLYLENAID
jgi:predicted nucleotidyltransferase component of viral defense system